MKDYLDLLIDLITMYSWKMDRGRKYNIIHFLELTNDAHAETYKNAFTELVKEV